MKLKEEEEDKEENEIDRKCKNLSHPCDRLKRYNKMKRRRR